MALTKIPANMLSGVDLGDSVRVNLGTDNDLALFHTGGNGVIHNTTGELRIRANTLKLQDYSNEDLMIVANSNGSVDLYHNNQKKFETSATGASVTGNLAVSGNLTVSGTTTELDTTNLNVTDKNITLNYHASSDTSSNADGAGITIQDAVNGSTDATLNWSAANDRFVMSHGLQVTSGSVGIGTTSPEHPLHVYDSGSNNTGTIKIGGSAASLGLEMSYTQAGNTTASILANPTYTNDDALLKIAVDGDRNANQLVLNGIGNVGIGTTIPNTKLHVNSTSQGNFVEGIRLENSGGGANEGAYIQWEIANSSGYGPRIGGRREGTGGMGLHFYTGEINAAPTEKMRIDHDGNVGIGTDSPTKLLHLQNNSDPTIMLTKQYSSTTGSIGSIIFGNGNWDSSMASIRGIQDGTNDGGKLEFKTQSDASGGEVTRFTIFRTGLSTFNGPASSVNLGGGSTGSAALYVNSTSGHTGEMLQILKNGSTRMHMSNDGKLGIGTASPNAPLEVNGGVGMTGGWGRSMVLRHNFPTLVWQSEYSTDAYAGIAYDNTTGMKFMVNSPTIDIFANSQTPALTILDNKNVGIGTANPTIGILQVHGGGASNLSTLHLQSDTSSQFNHSINSFNSNLTNGENNLFVLGKEGSTKNSAWIGYKWYSAGSDSNCLTFGHWGNNNILNLNGQGVFMAGGLQTAPTYPGAITTARTGNAGSTTQATWGVNSTASGSAIDFGFKTSGSGSFAVGVINHGETTWMSRLDYSGAIHLTNTTVQNISDRRLKKDIVDANSQWNDIKALQFKNYKWIDPERGSDTYLGLIADEVESVSPGLVGIDAISAETMPDDGIDPEYKNVKYSIVWMKAVKALQEAMAKIETLETKLEAAEARIATLEG